MRLTIIKEMGLVSVDHKGKEGFDTSLVPDGVRALQWYGDNGELEYDDNIIPNTQISELPDWAYNLYAECDAAIKQAEAELEADRLYWESDEGKAEEVRNIRDTLIAQTDWWELPSQAPMSQEREAYRQALRDITLQDGFPQNVVWPVKP